MRFLSRVVSRRVALTLSRASLAVAVLPPGASRGAAQDRAADTARNRDLVQRLFTEGINAGDEALLAALYAATPDPDRTEHTPAFTAADLPVSLRAFRHAAPGIVATVEALVADADLVAARVTWRGFAPPAGSYVAGQTLHLFRLEGEQILAQWSAGWEWLDERGGRPRCTPVNPLMTP